MIYNSNDESYSFNPLMSSKNDVRGLFIVLGVIKQPGCCFRWSKIHF